MTVEFNTGKTVGRQRRLSCLECGRSTDHSVLSSLQVRGDESSQGWSYSWIDDYEIVQCLGCKSPSFRLAKSNSEDAEEDENGDRIHPETVTLFPPRVTGHRGLGADVYLLPDQLRMIYRETLSALGNESSVLAGVGLRALVETVCKDNNAEGKGLASQINDLVAKQLLTPRDAMVLHKVRSLGNASAHEVKPHTPSQLYLALTIVEHLLRSVYVLPRRVKGEFG